MFTAPACGTAGAVGTTRWPELAPSSLVRLTSQDSTHDVSVLLRNMYIEYTLWFVLFIEHPAVCDAVAKCLLYAFILQTRTIIGTFPFQITNGNSALGAVLAFMLHVN